MLVRKRYQPTFRAKKRIEIERMADKKRPRSPERSADELRLTRRTLVFKGLAVTSFAAMTGRLWQLQVRDRQDALEKQKGFRERAFPLTAARGMIYDRNRSLLADNVKSWSVAVVPASLPSDNTEEGERARRAIYTAVANHLKMPDIVAIRPKELPEERGLREEIYARLAAALGLPVEEIGDPVERQIRIAKERRRAVQRSVKVPDRKGDLTPEQLAAARAIGEDLPGVHIVNPIDYQVVVYGEWDPYVPRVIKTDVPKEVALGIEANRLYLPGIQIDDNALSRRYHVGEELGHILGYTGPITGEELARAVMRDERGEILTDQDGEPVLLYREDDYLGKAGVEAGLEEILRGKPGRYMAQINAAGKIVGEFPEYRVNPVDGNSVVLTIPLDYQNEVIRILDEGIKRVKPYIEEENEKAKAQNRPDKVKPIPPPAGAAVAIDPRNGEILALVSLPGYDPKLFAKGITQKEFDVLLEKGVPDKEKRYPLQNRCIASQYPPGSTLKTFVALAGLQDGKIKPDTKFKCLGHIQVPQTYNEYSRNNYWCWTRDQSHQDLDVREALATSCDVFFYNTAAPRQPDDLGNFTRYYQPGKAEPDFFNGLGIQEMNKYLRLLGFGEKTGIELGDEVEGLVADPAWKEQTFPGDFWSIGDTINSSIGQGYMQVTPLQLCNATAAVANGGTLYQPTLVHEIINEQGQVVRGPGAKVVRKLPVSRQNVEIVREGMRMNIDWRRDNNVKGLVAPDYDAQNNPIPGSERFLLAPGIDAGVKTGTAEYDSAFTDNDGLLLKAHAWCAAFAPYNNPEICVLAFVEGGSASAAIAAPIARDMINAWFARKGR
jgi:penicillin-binding protein 2